ncbi:unnamed protein product [Arctogadus glacialis]
MHFANSLNRFFNRFDTQDYTASCGGAVTLLTVGRCRVFDPQPGAASRIPMSRGLKTSAKAGAAVATVTRMESRSEGQLMKIELRRSAGCGPASSSGGKS